MDINVLNTKITELDNQINTIKQKMTKRIDGLKAKQEKFKQKKNEYLLNAFKSAGLEELSNEQLEQVLLKISKEKI